MDKVTLLVYDPSKIKPKLYKIRTYPSSEGFCKARIGGTNRVYTVSEEQYKRGKRHFLCILDWSCSVDETVLNVPSPSPSSALLSRMLETHTMRNLLDLSDRYSFKELTLTWKKAVIIVLIAIPDRVISWWRRVGNE